MDSRPLAQRYLLHETRALLTRLDRVRPLAMTMPSVPAAAISVAAQAAVESYLVEGRRSLASLIQRYLTWLTGPGGRQAAPAEAQKRYNLLRLKFQAMLTQFDMFADVLNQRSEHDTGVWLAGLDSVATDALTLPGNYYQPPPVICYLERGIGAAIRRARTRMPGGGENPVAIIQVPRERMIGSGIASSLVHEVGHQASALLDLIPSFRPILQGLQRVQGRWQIAWKIWERWLSEILSDFWSVARVGVAGTLGLMNVVSLPRAFIFRVNLDDPHPAPWMRVKLSCAMGQALFPHPQWERLRLLWESLYPVATLDSDRRRLFDILEKTMPGFVALLLHHRPASLRGKSLMEAMTVAERQPARLAALFKSWRGNPNAIRATPPTLAFAVIGQAKIDGLMSPEEECRLLDALLRHWALRATLNMSTVCAALGRPQVKASAA
ncbi:MAG: hypothetical protein L6277_04610 [Desulfobacterales bacterium]|nr:hypothetical protein [Pseudomonadota bacterium]MBU4356991.1 hypothetical protein [Pseudomonadota bacterium]MCG2771355.1 hypothetical protein [Desulfobacterales bacterium]